MSGSIITLFLLFNLLFASKIYFKKEFPASYLIKNEINYFNLSEYVYLRQYYTLEVTVDPPNKVQYIPGEIEQWNRPLLTSTSKLNSSVKPNLIFEWHYPDETNKYQQSLYTLDTNCREKCNIFLINIVYNNNYPYNVSNIVIDEPDFSTKFLRRVDKSIWVGGFKKNADGKSYEVVVHEYDLL